MVAVSLSTSSSNGLDETTLSLRTWISIVGMSLDIPSTLGEGARGEDGASRDDGKRLDDHGHRSLSVRASREGRGRARMSAGRPRPRAQRSDLNAVRSSAANSFGSSQAAKWPPLSTTLKYARLG